ncbi:hypothetical protein BGE01nite_36670 [Brevifollis gellanilyticus]|uniref:Uncharacterized protein n=1 Tax=Brevifollis gellanilyticus TaxID=748831 RepID=A0A512MCC5_9BACT|nr:hypothetical protein BGE01nite_36670 [Brevifollis gellanilyticus]
MQGFSPHSPGSTDRLLHSPKNSAIPGLAGLSRAEAHEYFGAAALPYPALIPSKERKVSILL